MKFGHPIVKLVPYHNPHSLYGMFKDECQIVGNIMEPIDVDWEAMKDDDNDY